MLKPNLNRFQKEPLNFRNIHFSNITAETNEAIYINGLDEMPVSNITFNDIQFEARTGANIKMAQNIEFANVRINTQSGPSIVAANINDLVIDGVRTMRPLTGTPTISLTNAENVFLSNCSPLKGTDVFLQLKGTLTKDVVLKGNNFRFTKTPVDKETAVGEAVAVE